VDIIPVHNCENHIIVAATVFVMCKMKKAATDPVY